jgi:hypothetical protein
VAQARTFQGRLEDFSLVDLLQAMNLDNKSGALHLNADTGRSGIVYFDHGVIVGAQEQDREALTLGNVLQQLQFASKQQMDHVFQQQTQDALGKRIGERLVDLRIITPQQLERALRTQTLWTIRELSLWKAGEYVFHSGEQMPADALAPRTETTNAIMEALRYQHEWDALEYVLPDGMRTYLSMASEPPIDHPLQFHRDAWRIISRVNSHHTVRRIATSLRMPELDVARMVGPLVREGLLTPSRVSGEPGRPEVAARIDLQSFDLFTLLISMEQVWIKCKTDVDRLVALARFINETMDALEETYRSSEVTVHRDTLANVLEREGIVGVGTYHFVIENNRIDVDDFATYCRRVFDSTARSSDTAPSPLFVEYRDELQRALASAFHAINARIASPGERVQNQEAWEALFAAFTS